MTHWKVIKGFAGLLFFALTGYVLTIIAPDCIPSSCGSPTVVYSFGLVIMILSLLVGILLIALLLKTARKPGGITQGVAEMDRELASNPITSRETDLSRYDRYAFHFLRQHPAFAIPYLASIAAVILLSLFEFTTLFLGHLFETLSPSIGVWSVFLYIGSFLFLCFIFFIVGFLWLGEMMRHTILARAKTWLIPSLIRDFLLAIPYVVLLALLSPISFFVKWWWLLLGPAQYADANTKIPRLIIPKFYCYLNLAAIVFDESRKRTTFRETRDFLREWMPDFFFFQFSAGSSLKWFTFSALVLAALNEKFSFAPRAFMISIAGALLLAFLVVSLWTQQIFFLSAVVEKRYKAQDSPTE